jgi:hypothetical protein
MTQKELLYLEDAYMHEENIIGICNSILEELEDEDLVCFIDGEVKKHSKMLCKLEDFLKEKANE